MLVSLVHLVNTCIEWEIIGEERGIFGITLLGDSCGIFLVRILATSWLQVVESGPDCRF